MSDYKNIDDFFRDRGSNLKVTPTEEVWEKIDSNFFNTNRGRKKYIIYWFVASILLFSGLAIIWNFAIDKDIDDNQVINNNKLINNTNDQNIKKYDSVVYNKSLNNEAIAQTKVEIPEKIKLTKTKSTSNIEEVVTSDNKKSNFSDYDFKPVFNERAYFSIIMISKKSNISLSTDYTNKIYDRQIVTIEEYIERRQKIHMYTGASASFAMSYYPTTEDQTTWSTDLVYGIKLNKFYIETGVGFQKMKEQGTFKVDYRTNDSIGFYNKVLSFELNPENPNEITYNTKTTTVYDSIDHFLLQSPVYNYDYLVIPVKFGYKFFKNSQFSISAETGVIYSLLTKTYTPMVSYENPESQVVSITDNTPVRVEHNFRIHIALRLNYNITKTISVTTQPEFTSFINSIYTEKSNRKKVKPYTMGIRFGIYYDF
jgi:hypothetical protein